MLHISVGNAGLIDEGTRKEIDQKNIDTVIWESHNNLLRTLIPCESGNKDSLGKWSENGIDINYLEDQLRWGIEVGVCVVIRNRWQYLDIMALTYIGKSHFSDKHTGEPFLKFKDKNTKIVYAWNGRISEEKQIFLRKKTEGSYEWRDQYIMSGFTHSFIKLIIPKAE